jgi:formate--tetrahydrofolate ligase
MGLTLADYVVTEAGFGADLGAEKFLDIKCRMGDFGVPDAIVLVATTKALKYNGGVPKDKVKEPNMEALKIGIANLQGHVANLKSYNIPVIICINKFNTDTPEELDYIKNFFPDIPCAICDSFSNGGEGAIDLALEVVKATDEYATPVSRPYETSDPIWKKIYDLARNIYGAEKVEFSSEALTMIKKIEDMGYGNTPICVAKTQYSFSDNQELLGRPTGFTMHVNEVRLSAGAGFVVVICGKIMTMPGLPKHPAAENIGVDDSNNIVGLF